jgi:hypothetical protein
MLVHVGANSIGMGVWVEASTSLNHLKGLTIGIVISTLGFTVSTH